MKDAPAQSESGLVFVYGGLMRGFDLHHVMANGTFVGEATTPGVLVALGRYPGLIEGDGIVRGELYRFDDLPSILEVLDDIESYDPADPEGSPYIRELRPVQTNDGQMHSAWVYRFNGKAEAGERVPDGDWRAHSNM